MYPRDGIQMNQRDLLQRPGVKNERTEMRENK